MSRPRHRNSERDAGFTLIELAVVILIIGVLIGIAFPIFLRVQRSAKDRTAQNFLKQTLSLALSLAEPEVGFGPDNVSVAGSAGLIVADPSLFFIGTYTGSPNPRVSSVYAYQQWFVAANRSKSGKCFAVISNSVERTYNARVVWTETPTKECSAGKALDEFWTGTATTW
jgi:prepilin-type N-terminal cleavage/methylation domain-containing protein